MLSVLSSILYLRGKVEDGRNAVMYAINSFLSIYLSRSLVTVDKQKY